MPKTLKILGTIGDEKNLLIKDCPLLVPKENIKIFIDFSQAIQKSRKEKSGKYGNVID